MLRGLWKLTWLEIKIFVREPLGVIGTLVVPVVIFLALGRMIGPEPADAEAARFVSVELPVFASLLIAINIVLSLVTIIAIYRESGILKRLRATPLRPLTILAAHVLVKLLSTAATLAALLLAGRGVYPMAPDVPIISFALALLFTTVCILSLGFVIASVVPTARFAQPLGSLLLYPMFGICGLFAPVDSLPPAIQPVARTLPLTYATSLLKGVWTGDGWSAHAFDAAVLALMFLALTAIAARVFRWE